MKVTSDVKHTALLEGSSYPSGGDERLGEADCYEKDIEAEEVDNEYYKESLKQDLPDVRIKRNYHCKWCGHFTQNPREFLYHIKNFHGQKFRIYECPECVYASKHSQKLQRHYKMIHDKRNSNSARVNRIKKSRHTLSPRILHTSSPVRKFPSIGPVRPASVSESEDIEGSNSMEMEDFEKMYNEECPVSPVATKSKTSSNMLTCSHCHFQTKNDVLLKRHEILNHLKKKFFRCKKCNYVTWVKARFTKHMKYHDMPMIKCDLCDFTTPYKWNLDRHMKNHLGGGYHRCQKCNFTANIRQSLTFHIQHHHLKNGEPAVRRFRKKPSYDELGHTNGDAEFIEDVDFVKNTSDVECDESDYMNAINSETDMDTNDGDTNRNENDNPDSTFEVCNLELDSSQDYQIEKLQESERWSKKQPKIKITLKKTKHSVSSSGQVEGVYGDDFIDPDDIVQKNGEVFIKDLKCTKCNYKTAFELDLLKHDQKAHSLKSNNGDSMQYESANGLDNNNGQTILKVPQVQPESNCKSISANFENLEVCPDFLGVKIKEEASDELDINDASLQSFEDDAGAVATTVEAAATSDHPLEDFRRGNVSLNSDSTPLAPKKSGTMYDDLKQKVPESGVDNLVCNICGHKAKYLSEAMRHRKVEHKQQMPATNRGNRCQYCRRRCKTELDLIDHETICEAALAAQGVNSGSGAVDKGLDPLGDSSHPMENKVFVWNNFNKSGNSSGNGPSNETELNKSNEVGHTSRPESSSSFYNESIGTPDSASVHEENDESYILADSNDGLNSKKVKLKKVYKCPNCSFWATTASRFHVHIVGHLNMKPFKCSVCSYKSNWRWDITKHIKLKANRDGAHLNAQVMMTDNSGERNYEKYEKFLTLMPLEDPSLSCMPNESLSNKSKVKQVTPPVPKQVSQGPKLQPRSKGLPSLTRHKPINNVTYKTRPGSFLEKHLGRNAPPPLIRNPNVQTSQFGHYRIPSPGNYRNISGRYPQPPKLTRAPMLRQRTSDSKVSPLVHSGTSPSSNSYTPSQSSYSTSYSMQSDVTIYPSSKSIKRSTAFNIGSSRNSNKSLHDSSSELDNMSYQKRSQLDDECPEPEKTKVFVTEQGVPKRATVWKCKKCSYRRPDKRMVLAHMAKHYSMQNFFLCGFCGFTSNWQSVVRRHCRLKHNGNVSVVENKPKGSIISGDEEDEGNLVEDLDSDPSKDIVDTNAKYIYEEMRYECKICSYTTKKRPEMRVHLQFHIPRPDAIYKCVFCPYYVSVRRALHQHIKLHGVSEPKRLLSKVFGKSPEDDKDSSEEQMDDESDLSQRKKTPGDDDEVVLEKEVKRFQCLHCPFVSNNQYQYLYHKQLHRPQKAAQFKCMYCSYNVSRRHLLLKHLKLHRQKLKSTNKKGSRKEEFVHMSGATRDSVEEKSLEAKNSNFEDKKTNESYDSLSRKDDVPLVWVSRGNKFFKMYKCHYCPHVNLRKSNIQEHEKMHQTRKMVGEVHNCPLCNYSCSNAGVMAVHMRVHRNKLGKVHGYVDSSRSDAEQLKELNKNAVLGKPADFTLKQMRQAESESNTGPAQGPGEELKSLYFCPHCPARFLKDTEIDIHKKFHSLRLQYGCQQCNYTARQEAHLMAHMKVHSSEYLEKTIRLLQVHPVSNKYPIPAKVAQDIPVNLHQGKQEPIATSKVIPVKQLDNYCNVSPSGKEKIHPCPRCPAKFIKLSTLQYHLSLHGSSDSYKCDRPSCDYAVKTVGNLVRHQMMHQQHEAMLKRQAAVSSARAEKAIGMSRTNNGTENSDPYDELKRMNNKVKRYDDIPMSGVDLLKKKLQYEKECSQKPDLRGATLPTRGYTKKDDPARIGNPAFIYPTIIKNGKVKEKRYKCQNCPTALEKRDQYKVHMTLHGAENKYTCEKCQYSVKYYANYLQHIEKHQRFEDIMRQQGLPVENATVARPPDSPMFQDNNKLEKCSPVAETPPSVSTPSPQKTPVYVEPFGIQEQSLTPAEKQQLVLQELRTNSGANREENKRAYHCSYCPFSSLKKDHLKSHSQRHRSNGAQCLFSCHHCDYTAPQSHFLREHIKCHFRPPKISFKPEAFYKLEDAEIICHIDTHKSEHSEEGEGFVHGAVHKPITVFKFSAGMEEEKVFNDFPEDCEIELIDMKLGEPVKQERDEGEVIVPNCEDRPS